MKNKENKDKSKEYNDKDDRDELLEKKEKRKIRVLAILVGISIVIMILLLVRSCEIDDKTDLPVERQKLIDDGSGNIKDGKLMTNAEIIRMGLQEKADESVFVPSHTSSITIKDGNQEASLFLSNKEENSHKKLVKGEDGKEVYKGKAYKVVYEIREIVENFNDIQTFDYLEVARNIVYKNKDNVEVSHREDIRNIDSLQKLNKLKSKESVDIDSIEGLRDIKNIVSIELSVRELIYKTKALNTGQYIDKDFLFKIYPKGVYDAIVYSYIYDEDTDELAGKAGGKIKIIVQNDI